MNIEGVGAPTFFDNIHFPFHYFYMQSYNFQMQMEVFLVNPPPLFLNSGTVWTSEFSQSSEEVVASSPPPPFEDAAWCFYSFTSKMDFQLNVHDVLDIVTCIYTEI